VGGSPTGAQFSMVTYNLYLGADLESLLRSNPSTDDAPSAVADTFSAVQATSPEERMAQIASELAAIRPDLVALQEVSLWRTQTPADGTATPADEVAYDFLSLLLDALAMDGLTYAPAIVGENADVEVTADLDGTPTDVRLTDRDVILVNSASTAIAITTTGHGSYTAHLELPTTAFGTVNIKRGWVSVDANFNGAAMRFIGTHLDTVSEIAAAQIGELLAGPVSGPSRRLLTGDFNLTQGTLGLSALTTAGMVDEWNRVHPGDPQPTCCQAPDLQNDASALTDRIDYAFSQGKLGASAASRIGVDPTDKTPSGLWPSDHAGVYFQIVPTQ
jgi:endonuclease/exonuclease/phosphatase family metal-dependent hydrolase